MGAVNWFRHWLYGLDELTGKLEGIVYKQIPHLGSLLHYIRFFYLFAAPATFLVFGPLVLKGNPAVIEIINNVLLFLKEALQFNIYESILALQNIFSYHVKVLMFGFVAFCFVTWAADLFDDYARMDLEKVEKGYSKRYLSPIAKGSVDKGFVKASVIFLYVLCALSIIFLYVVSRNVSLAILFIISAVGFSAYTDYYLPRWLQRRFKNPKKSIEVLFDVLQNYLYLVPAFYASWAIFRPISEMPNLIHIFINVIFFATYYAFEYMDWEADRNTNQWTISNVLSKKTSCYIGFILCFLLVPFGLIGASAWSHLLIKLFVILVFWAISCLFLATFYKKPMMSLHGAYAMLCSYPVMAVVLFSYHSSEWTQLISQFL
jgi:4-hydroxybenzoate polyprenyltransferase